MTAEWLTFQSFQRSQEVLQAINALSIHLRLKLNGVVDEERSKVADRSVRILQAFLDEIDEASSQADGVEPKLMLGVDSRLQQLVQSYLTARRYGRFRSRLLKESIDSVKPLLMSDSRTDQEALLECLDELRVLVEEHMQDDADRIMGNVL
jgi:hypothetical protein